jgi:cytosine/adenosine deaminase-related metal-dependent hydrolase
MAPKIQTFLGATCAFLAIGVSARAQVPTPKLIITHAHIMTMAGPIDAKRPPIDGYISIAPDGTILAVAAGDPPASLHATTTVDAHGDYIVPGFISAHSHLWQAAYRGLAADKTLHGWIDDLYTAHATKSTPEDQYWFTLLGCLDHLERGVTTAYDFTYSRPTPTHTTNDYEESIFKAESASGIRFVHSYSPARMGSTITPAEGRANLKAFLDWTAAQPADPRFLSVMLGGMTAFNNTEQQSVFEAAAMKEFHLGNQTHFVEPPDDQGEQRSKFRWMLDSGLVTDKLIFGHFIHTDDFILQQTAKAHASMVWNPLSNGRLASGTADIPKYLKMGVRVGMGVDGEASADLADPFENMRTGLYAIRDKYEDATIMSPYQVLWLHTAGSADVLDIKDKVGSLEPGKFADLVLVNPTRLGVVFEDPYANLVLIAGERDIDSVYVGGELMVDHNKLLHQDLDKAQTESNRRVLAEQ